MANDKAKPSPSKGAGSKRFRHSAQTKANKQRAAETRARRLEAAERRRHSETYIDPQTGKKRLRGLPEIIERRQTQARHIAIKRMQRQNFNKLSDKLKKAHREAGKAHGN